MQDVIQKIQDDVKSFSGFNDIIASKTKLLAVNANITAARAGEAGKGLKIVLIERRQSQNS